MSDEHAVIRLSEIKDRRDRETIEAVMDADECQGTPQGAAFLEHCEPQEIGEFARRY